MIFMFLFFYLVTRIELMNVSNVLLIDIANGDVIVSLCSSVGKILDQQIRSFDCHDSQDFGLHCDANEFLYATRSAINSLIVALPKRQQIHNIGIVGQMNTFLFCDKESGIVLTPSFFLEDDRALDTYLTIKNTSIIKGYRDITEQSLSRYSLFTHLKWFLEKGISSFSFSPQRSLCMSLELYLLFNLSGLTAFQQDFVSASSTGFFDFKANDFSSIIIKDLNLTRQCFPDLVSPFAMQQNSKGFVPLKDGIPVSFMIHSSVKNWLFDSNIQCGALNIHVGNNHISIEQHMGMEMIKSDQFISKSLVVKKNESFYCLKDFISVPHFSTKLLPLSFSELVAKKVALSNFKSWIIFNPDSSDLNQDFALINQGGNSLDYLFETALLEGLFNVLRFKLATFETVSNMRPHTFYCTSTLAIHDSVWQFCADILQHPLVILDSDQSHLGLVNELQLGNQNSHVIKPYQSKIVTPIQDPISSYARYQSWVTYYQKIFKN